MEYVLVSMLGVLLVGVTRMLLRLDRRLRCYRQACDLLGEHGGFQRAEALFQKAARGLYGTHRTAALAGVGLCRMQRGGYAQAAAVLEPLMAQRLPRSMRLDEVVLPGHLALCLAMLGETS